MNAFLISPFTAGSYSAPVTTFLGSADAAGMRTAIGLGTADSPTFAGILAPTWTGLGGTISVITPLTNGLRIDQYGGSNKLELIAGDTNAFSGLRTSGTTIMVLKPASGILEQFDGGTPQLLRVYNSKTDNNNYDRAVFDFRTTLNTLRIGTENSGTVGFTTPRSIEFAVGGVVHVTISAAGAVVVGRSGTAGSLSMLNSVGSGGLQLSGTPSYGFHMAAPFAVTWGSATQLNGTLDTGLARNAAGTVEVNTGTAGTYGFLKAKLQTSTAYTAGSASATGYLTIYDSTGTAYRVFCAV